MHTYSDAKASSNVDVILARLRERGVVIWTHDNQLHYKAPVGALSADEIGSLKSLKRELIAALEVVGDDRETELRPRSTPDHAPLTFSQLAHWYFHGLAERSRMPQIAAVRRLSGRLNVDALQGCIQDLTQRHEALRTRIVKDAKEPYQEILRSVDHELNTCKLAEDSVSAVGRCIEEFLQQPMNVFTGPLLRVRLAEITRDEHLLVLAMDHMVSDMLSMGIFLRDLGATYMQGPAGSRACLPSVPIQFADYAAWQRKYESAWTRKHNEYWNERLMACPRMRFPDDKAAADEEFGWNSVPVRLGRLLKSDLVRWCRSHHTTVVMAVFSAYAGLLLRWCGVKSGIVQYQSSGRTRVEVESTIGYFASMIYVPVALSEGDSFDDLLKRITDEYCSASDHADFSYMAARASRPAFTRNPVFNWIPLEEGEIAGSTSCASGIRWAPVPFMLPAVREFDFDREPGIVLQDKGEEVIGAIYFPRSRFCFGAMERFGSGFVALLEALVTDSRERVMGVSLG